MIEVGSYEAKTRLPELLRRVEAGESVTVTRRGKVIARIVPPEPPREDVRKVIEEILEARKRMPRVTVEDILEMRDEGRRF
jgi:prevent-host-death family protein